MSFRMYEYPVKINEIYFCISFGLLIIKTPMNSARFLTIDD